MATGWGRFRRYDPPARGSTVSRRLRNRLRRGPTAALSPRQQSGQCRSRLHRCTARASACVAPRKCQLDREGTKVEPARVARLMADIDIKGFIRGKRKRISHLPGGAGRQAGRPGRTRLQGRRTERYPRRARPLKATLGRSLSGAGLFAVFAPILGC